MAYHIPFNQRNRRPPVVYIGFETPTQRRKFNWWGFNGFWMSIGAFFTAGLLSPISLLVSMKGLKQKHRKMAVAGTVLSLAGTGLFVALLFGSVSDKAHRKYVAKLRLHNARVHKQVVETTALLDKVAGGLIGYREDHNGELPNWVDGNVLSIQYTDSWGKELRFDAEGDYAILRSAGPDGEFDNDDDVQCKVMGKTDNDATMSF